MTKFSTYGQVRKFLRENGGGEFKGVFATYTLADGRKVQFSDRSTTDTWGGRNEATTLVEVAA
jgi:hypothetical protein